MIPRSPAVACSAGEDFNPVTSSDLIVAGTIISWSPAPDPPNLAPRGTFQTVQVTLSVEATFRGASSPGTIDFFDTASLFREGQGPPGWHGSSGACGAFSADPAGQYVLLGLTRADDGTLRSHLLRTFYFGEKSEFTGARYQRTREVLDSFGLTLPSVARFIGPPSTGDAGLVTTK